MKNVSVVFVIEYEYWTRWEGVRVWHKYYSKKYENCDKREIYDEMFCFKCNEVPKTN